MKKFFFLFFAAVVACCAACSSSKTDDGGESQQPTVEGRFTLHSSLQNGMVIQQNRPFRIWGRSLAGVKVTAAPGWTDQTYSTIVPEGGYWTLDVPVPAAPADNAPQSITVSTTLQTETLSDLLIGEVWLLGGQSNMAFPMSQTDNAQAEIAAADHPMIRYFATYPQGAKSEQYDWRNRTDPFYKWYKTSPETVAWQSAVGYYFGLMLHETLGVPIGLINTSNGGATAQAYTPLSALESNMTLKATYVDPFVNHQNILVRPAELYNSMVHPLHHFSIRGVCWYQGEGNWDTYTTYPELMRTLIRSWRRNFGQADLPFYYVQIAAWGFGGPTGEQEFFYSNGAYKGHSGYFYQREAQAKTRDEVEHTGMAVTMDVGNPEDIHPIWKRPVGERLARLALHDTYGMADVACLGPRYRSHRVENGVVKVSFDHAEGLRTNDSQAPKYFYLAPTAGSTHEFRAAAAEIRGDEVWLTCPEVVSAETAASDVAIRYAFLLYPVTNLENGEGLPAEPFRTDDWGPAAYSYVY